VSVPACYSCAQEHRLAEAADADRIWVGQHWRVAHCIRCALPGWLVLLPRRHTTAVSQHTTEEAAELGRLLVAASAAIEELTGCPKTYVAQFAEAKGFSHTHFHVIPRAADLPADRIGPGIFGYLAGPESEQLSDAERDELARAFQPIFVRLLGSG
jgi:diadenosine tetraphosphate (Ap4A) HIT family hydrolase